MTIIILLLLPVSSNMASIVNVGGKNFVKVKEDPASFCFAQVFASSYSAVNNTVRCASVCLQEELCVGFYYDSNGKVCHLGQGTLLTSPDNSYNLPGISMYRDKSLVAESCPSSAGFQEKTINSKRYCFLFVDVKVGCSTAQTRCWQEGAFLFRFDDDIEKLSQLDEITGSRRSVDFVWTGLHSLPTGSNRWYWHHSGAELSDQETNSLPWYSDAYTEGRSACAVVRLNDGLLLDSDPSTSTNNHRFVCEIVISA